MTQSQTPSSSTDSKATLNAPLSLPEIKELPPWFNIENYAKAASLGIGGWLDELYTRLSLKENWHHYGNLTEGNHYTSLLEQWKSIQQYGLISLKPGRQDVLTLEEPVDLSVLFPNLTFPRPQPKPDQLPPLSSLTPITNDMMNFSPLGFNTDAIIRKIHLKYDYKKEMVADEKERQAALAWFSQPTEFIHPTLMQDNLYLAINLMMTDEQILKDFKRWLAHERRYGKRGHDIILWARRIDDWEIERDHVYLYLIEGTLECAVKDLYNSIFRFAIRHDELLPVHAEAIKNALTALAKAKKTRPLKEDTRQAIFEFTTKMGYPPKRQAPRKNFTQSDFLHWSEMRVLPYWDLVFWAKMEGVHIRQRTLGYGIFTEADAGSGFDPPDRLRSTRKKAAYLVSPPVIALLFELFDLAPCKID